MKEHDERLRSIFVEALSIENFQQQAAYVTAACGSDTALRRKIEQLLLALSDHNRFRFGGSSTAGGSSGSSGAVAANVIDRDRAAAQALATPKAGDRISHYRLVQQIGEGGCGIVYLAAQEWPVYRSVALKVIKLGMDTKSVVARFEAERQALALMDHPNIARVIDAGATDTGRPFFVMDLVTGIPITNYCEEQVLSIHQRLELLIQICRAVQYAHHKGIIHRDLKPSNILVTAPEPGKLGVPKIIDFGIAKATTGRLSDHTYITLADQFIGTPAYMSPEQTEPGSLDIDTRSDIYSLGVLLYELLTGKTPFEAKALRTLSLDEMCRTIREKEPPRPSARLTLELPVAPAGRSGSRSSFGNRQAVIDRPADLRCFLSDSKTAGPAAGSRQPSRSGLLEARELCHLLRGDLDWIVMKCLEKDRTRRYETANDLATDLQHYLDSEPVLATPPSMTYSLRKFARRNRVMVTAACAVATVLVIAAVVSTWLAVRATRLRAQADFARATTKAEAQRAEREKNAARQNAYAANLLVALADWDNNDINHLEQVLENNRDYPDRGFEWYYWQRQCHLAAQTLSGHLAPVFCVAAFPGGQRIVTGSDDGAGIVWDLATGRQLFELKGHRQAITAVAVFADGRRMMTASYDRTAKLWDAETGAALATFRGHVGVLSAVAVSPDGQHAVTAGERGTAKVWNVTTGIEEFALQGHGWGIQAVTFSPDGQLIITASWDWTAGLWEANSGKLLRQLKGHTGGVTGVAVSPDGQRIVTASADRTAKIWEASTGHELQTLQGHTAGLQAVAYSPDGRYIVTTGREPTARVWDAETGQEFCVLKGHTASISGAAFLPDSRRLVTVSTDRTIKVWGLADHEEITLAGHTKAIAAAAFSADGRRLITGSQDQTARLWDAHTGRTLRTFAGHAANLCAVAFSPDGQRIATGSEDHTARIWDAGTGQELLRLSGHQGWVRGLAFAPDGHHLATGSLDQTVRLWDTQNGHALRVLKVDNAGITSLAFSPDGRHFVTGDTKGVVEIWDVSTGDVRRKLSGPGGAITSVAFSPNGRWIVAGNGANAIRSWDTVTGLELPVFKGHTTDILAAAFSPDSHRIATGGEDSAVRVWDSATGYELLMLAGHGGAITAVAFSPDGREILSGSKDGTARIWQSATEEQTEAWRAEERRAAEALSLLAADRTRLQEQENRVRAADPGTIKQWLVLAPVPLAKGEAGVQGLQREEVPGEANVRPHAGDSVTIEGAQFIWNPVVLSSGYVLDLTQLLGEQREYSVAYAVCYLVAERPQSGLRLKMGSDDQARVYLNGKAVCEYRYPRAFIPDDNEVSGLELLQGTNVLVFKIVNERFGSSGSLRLTDQNGGLITGVKVTLTP